MVQATPQAKTEAFTAQTANIEALFKAIGWMKSYQPRVESYQI